jgi:hypothetical protein
MMLLLVVASCAGLKKAAPPPVPSAHTEAVPAAPSESSPPVVEEESLRRLSLMEQALKHRAVSVDAPVRRAGAESADGEATRGFVEDSSASASGATESVASPSGEAAAATKSELVAELASQIREQAKGSSAPAAALLRLAALELVEPGAGGSEALNESALTPGELDFLRAWRELFAAARDGLNSSGDIGPLASRVADLAERMQSSQPLAVIDARLCLRVDGYGMYSEMPRGAADRPYVLTAGRRARAIVYVELSNYVHTPAKKNGVEGFEVRLAQDLTLYHAGSDGDTIVWRRPFQDIHDFSRKRRRDFFTTQIIELPATLGVGAYRLKVTVSDKASAAAAEAILSIAFVAESAAR